MKEKIIGSVCWTGLSMLFGAYFMALGATAYRNTSMIEGYEDADEELKKLPFGKTMLWLTK